MFQLVLTFLAIILIFILFKWKSRPKNFPPGPTNYPVIGTLPAIASAKLFHFTLDKMRQTYGPVVGLMLGSGPAIAVCGPKEVLEALKKEELQGRPKSPLFMARTFGKPLGIIFSDGPFWKEQRRFTLRHLREFGFGKTTVEGMIHSEIDDFFENFLNDKDKVQVSGLFNTSAINVIWAMIGGVRFSHYDENFRMLLESLHKFFRNGVAAGGIAAIFPILRHVPLLKNVRALNEATAAIMKFLTKTIEEHRKTKTEVPRDFIDVYLDEIDKNNNPDFNMESLMSNCTDLFAAGAEAVGNTLAFYVLYLVLYPDLQEELHKEIMSTLGNEKVALKDRARMPKMEAFQTEVIRINPIAPLTPPHRAMESTTLNGYEIPKNTLVFVSLWSLFHDKEHWGDPENFRPWRFLDKDGNFAKDEWLQPFGSGKRICPGEGLARNHLFIFLTSLIQNYEFSIPEGHPKPSTLCLPGLTTAPRPFEVKIRKR